MTQARRKRNMTLRFEQGEPLPHAGETVKMQSSFGSICYEVHITRVRRQEQHEDGAALLRVDASVKQVQR